MTNSEIDDETNPEYLDFIDENTYKIHGIDCWIWLGRYNRSNMLGGIRYKGKYTLLNRLFYKWANKQELPLDKTIRMTCQNTLCFNPAHMYLIDKNQYMLIGNNHKTGKPIYLDSKTWHERFKWKRKT